MFLGNLIKVPAMVLCLGEPPGGFCDAGCCCCLSSLDVFTFPDCFSLPMKASTRSELYPGYFWLLYFCQVFSSQFYRERYSFEWACFTRRRFLPYAPSPTFLARFSDSDAGKNTPSRILLCACYHRVVPSG